MDGDITMAAKKGCKLKTVNIPVEEMVTLKDRSDLTGENVNAIINRDIVRGNQEFKDTQTE